MKRPVLGFFITIFFAAFNLLSAQNNEGSLDVIQDSRVNELQEKHIQFNEVVNTISGFRVNIFFQSGNNSKNMANQIRAKFAEKYPDIPAYIVFEEPNFKVKVGDFRTRVEARGFLEKIKIDFPDAFVSKDEIYFPAIVTSEAAPADVSSK